MPMISKEERQALDALDTARLETVAADADMVGRAESGEAYAYLSAARVDEIAAVELGKVDIEWDLASVKVEGMAVSTEWTWRHDRWRSEPTTIHVRLMADMSAAGMVTLARKLYLRNLLRLRVEQDAEADLANAADGARDVVWEATRELLRAYCRRGKHDESRVISSMTGFQARDPHGAPSRVPVTFEMLPGQHVAMLYARLVMQVGPETSKAWSAGATPDGVEELPESMGGSMGGADR